VYTGGPNYRIDGNTSNDVQTFNFTVGGTATQTNDAGINTIVSPTSSITADSIQPIGVLKNFGQATLTSASLRYKLDNAAAVIMPWSGSLASGASVNYTFPKVPITAGTHTIQVYTVNPNSQTDANTTNDSQTLVFNVVSPYITDVEAVSVGEPFALGCATTVLPLMVIKNEGPVTLDQVTINYQVDADPVVSRTYSVAMGTGLPVGEAMGLRGNASTVTVGVHSLKMWSSFPNTVTDGDNSNDTTTTTFTVGTNGQALPFTEDFESITAGQVPANWTRYNWDAFNEWFVYGMPTNKAMAFNNFAYTGAQNTRDDLTLPILDLTGNSTAWLTFDLSHASKPNSTVFDSLEVSVSTDCGQTFTSVWGRGGAALNTVSDDSTIFIPTGAQDYQNVQIDLSAYTASSNAIIRFTNWSNNNNSTLIDNLNLLSTPPTGVEENNSLLSLNVFPNPASESIQVTSQLKSGGELKMRMVNSMGQTMDEFNYGVLPAGYHVSRIDVRNYPAGIYNILLISESRNVMTKKIVVIK
jgi:hypothetical protein